MPNSNALTSDRGRTRLMLREYLNTDTPWPSKVATNPVRFEPAKGSDNIRVESGFASKASEVRLLMSGGRVRLVRLFVRRSIWVKRIRSEEKETLVNLLFCRKTDA